MTNFRTLGRMAGVALVCAFIAACTQTSSSTFNGNVADPASAGIEAKREAARKRAADRKEARREAFVAKREEQREARAKETGKTAKTMKAAERAEKRKEAREARRAARKAARAERLAKRDGARVIRRKGEPAKAAKKKTRKKQAKRVAKKASKPRKSGKGKVQKVAPTKAAYAAGAARRISTNGKAWNCVPSRLKAVLADVTRRFGPVIINSTHRSGAYNRKVGGKRGSYHLKCAAVDFRVRGSSKGLTRYLAMHPKVGGYKRYASGFYHIDTGPKRTW